MADDEREYYIRRERDEREAEKVAKCSDARAAHRILALEYAKVMALKPRLAETLAQ